MQTGVPQDVPGVTCVQALAPLQVPVLPQVLAGHWPLGVPAGSGVQVPGDVPLQVSQVPQDALPQQTPLTQAPLVHSWPVPHATPPPFFARQEPPAPVQ